METALLLMIVGMGTVFIILILIIFLKRRLRPRRPPLLLQLPFLPTLRPLSRPPLPKWLQRQW